MLNFARREIPVKIVYAGPPFAGKTTNLEVLRDRAPDSILESRPGAEGQRTLTLELRPLPPSEMHDWRLKTLIVSLSSKIPDDAARRHAIMGADGVVFVADSQRVRLAENRSVLEALKRDLVETGIDPALLPFVFQWNKRDLPDPVHGNVLAKSLDTRGAPMIEAVALRGEGVVATLEKILELIRQQLKKEYGNLPGPRR